MEGKNWKPSKGQKVAFLISIPQLGIKEGDVKSVVTVYECKCGRWSADLDITLMGWLGCECAFCNNRLSATMFIADTEILAPVEKRTVAIDKEIWDSLPKETQERSDVVVKPQEASVQNQLLDTIDEMIALLPQIPIEQRFAYADKIVEAINRTCKLIRGE